MTDSETKIPLASSIPVNLSQFGLSIACRYLQGLTAVAPMLALVQSSSIDQAITNTLLCGSALLCGAAINVAVEGTLSAKFSVHTGCLAAALFSVLGLSMIWAGCPVELWPLPCLLIGLGIGSDWSSVSEVARRSLPAKMRWQGLRLWSMAFPMGSGVGLLLIINAHYVLSFFYLTLLMAAFVFLLLLLAKPLAAPRPVADAPAGVPANQPENSESDAAANVVEECDATECCGGGIREIQPTPFVKGVSLAAVGILSYYLAPWFVLLSGFRSQPPGAFEAFAVIAFAAGLPAGSLLMVSVAPRIGYVVAILPFLLLTVVFTCVYGFVTLSGLSLVAVAFACGVFPAAVATGISSIVGELFSDCPTDAKRSRVISVALFAASALMAVFSLVQTSSFPHAVRTAYLPSICLIGLFITRSLPSPIISSLGKDDDSSSEDEELKDVLARISK